MTRFSISIVLLLQASFALACGHCVEDKIAGVYDHAAVTQAIGARRTVVFFAIDGVLKPGQPMRMKIEKLAASVPGVDAGSVRVSMELAAVRRMKQKMKDEDKPREPRPQESHQH